MLHKIAWILLLVGGLNWLLEAFDYGIGNWIGSPITTIIYVLVGLSAVYEIFTHKSNCKCCEPKMGGSANPTM